MEKKSYNHIQSSRFVWWAQQYILDTFASVLNHKVKWLNDFEYWNTSIYPMTLIDAVKADLLTSTANLVWPNGYQSRTDC